MYFNYIFSLDTLDNLGGKDTKKEEKKNEDVPAHDKTFMEDPVHRTEDAFSDAWHSTQHFMGEVADTLKTDAHYVQEKLCEY